MTSWRKFRRLPAEEKSIFLSALALLPVVRAGLRAFGLRRVQAVLEGRDELTKRAETGITASRAARLVSVAARYAGGTCLARSIVLVSLLRRRGIPAELRIGVRKTERGVEAHAWVVSGGAILNDGEDVEQRFAAFDRDFSFPRMEPAARVNWR